MKKLLAVLCCGMLLVGCGESKPKAEVTKCSMDLMGMEMAIQVEAVDGIANKMAYVMTIPESMAGVDFAEITDEEKKQVEEMFVSSMGDEAMAEKCVITYDDDNMIISMDLDFEKDKDMIESLAGELPSDEDLKVDSFVTEMEDAGFTCSLAD